MCSVFSAATKGILRRLLNKRIIGSKHTPEGNVFNWIASLSLDEQKVVREEWEVLIKQWGWVFRQKKTGEWHISLNPKKLSEIYREIE